MTTQNFTGLNPTRPVMFLRNKHNLMDGQILHRRPQLQKEFGPLLDAQCHEDLAPLIDRMKDAAEAARKNRDISSEGRPKAIDGIHREAGEDLKKFHTKRRGKLEQDLAQAQRGLPNGEPPRPTSPEEIALDRETRDWLRGLKQPDREAAVKKAAGEGKIQIVGPALRDPTGQILRDHVRAEVKDTYLRAAHASAFERSDGIKLVMNLFDQNLATAAKAIGAHASDTLAALKAQAGPSGSVAE